MQSSSAHKYCFLVLAALFAKSVFGATDVSGSISVDTTWSDPVYHVVDSVTVEPGVTLTISTGAVVKFDYGKFLNVRGTLNAQGTDQERVYFTDIRDDGAGGDSNGDGSDTEPGVPWWQGIYVRDGGSALLDRVEIRYAGRYYQYYEPGAVYKTGSGTLTLTRSTIRDSDRRAIVLNATNAAHVIENNLIDGTAQYQGIYLRDASGNSTISDNLIIGAATYGIHGRDDSSATLSANTIRSSGHSGIFLGSNSITGDMVIENNTIEDSTYHGVYIQNAAGAVTVSNNRIYGNGNNGIFLSQSTLPITDNRIYGNAMRGIYLAGSETTPDIFRNDIRDNDIGILIVSSADPLIGGSAANANDIHANASHGVQNTTDTITVDARFNWWGAASGPYHANTNPDGEGNEVSDWVDYGDYLSEGTLQRIFQDRFEKAPTGIRGNQEGNQDTLGL
ncbi:right-handed parallel beta-helix repeat-containing protein [Wenzhouxiangella sediminis]|uniref:Right-handed parallel beta-helix repeat-containing protein n=1 Tax=Wenzhouxiangella sediminis TaxID=1792836 RepID=A0A3E1K5F4_9GAMM|nr:right-handed parallel beta-helix repeat-containing protein [Wenzhouxiangella sediminis]RFF29277.1 right-handed parallel beta-helix repeat-containing protein [Wenzhouxiangella sediminis]